jgi:radical SAM protein with 4Fe4S-binding SPASM domain
MNKVKVLTNNLRALKDYYGKKVHLDNLPTFIWLEPTNHCNLRCVMCPNGAGMVNITKGYMEFDFFTAIVDELSGYASAITLAVGGESLLHPRFMDMVRYISSKGIKVLLNTNATLLTKEMSEELLTTGIAYLSFAFDGFNKKSYEKARRGAIFEDTMDKVTYFLELRKKKRLKSPYCILSMLMLDLEPYTEQEKAAFLSHFEGLIDEVRMREVSTWGSAFKEADSFSHRKHEGIFLPCSRLWSTACITWNGDMVPCIYNTNHEFIIGNLAHDSLISLWNSENLMALRRAMLDASYLELSPQCDNCIVLGTPPILGIPSGLRLSLADAMTNVLGYGFEKASLSLANKFRKNSFSSRRVK